MKDSPQVTLIQNEEVVETLAAKAPHKPLADRIGSMSLERGPEYVDPAPRRYPGERRAEFRVIVTDEILGALVERGGLT